MAVIFGEVATLGTFSKHMYRYTWHECSKTSVVLKQCRGVRGLGLQDRPSLRPQNAPNTGSSDKTNLCRTTFVFLGGSTGGISRAIFGNLNLVFR
jgi:hypothetical protein